jgi:hypothetical protein
LLTIVFFSKTVWNNRPVYTHTGVASCCKKEPFYKPSGRLCLSNYQFRQSDGNFSGSRIEFCTLVAIAKNKRQVIFIKMPGLFSKPGIFTFSLGSKFGSRKLNIPRANAVINSTPELLHLPDQSVEKPVALLCSGRADECGIFDKPAHKIFDVCSKILVGSYE